MRYKEEISIKLSWPKDSQGLDVSQIVSALDRYLRSYEKKPKTIDAGSGRRIRIQRSAVKAKPKDTEPDTYFYQ